MKRNGSFDGGTARERRARPAQPGGGRVRLDLTTEEARWIGLALDAFAPGEGVRARDAKCALADRVWRLAGATGAPE